jgi:hypothetical protein
VADDAEIEITPEMIEAGASVLYRMELAFANEEFYAERIYRAMFSRSPIARAIRSQKAADLTSLCGSPDPA